MLIAQTFCNIHFIYVWNCKNSRCYKKLQLLLDQSRLAVLLILFFFGQKKSFLWQIWQKRLLWLKSILCNHNSVITLLSTHEIIHGWNDPNRRVHVPKFGLYQLYIKLGSELLATSLPITFKAPNKRVGWNKRARGEIFRTW